MKCRYSHCKHSTTDISQNEDFVQHGNAYYHCDCDAERLLFNDIITVFMEQVNAQISVAALRKVINDIVFNCGMEAEYVMYALKYAISHPEIRLTYPGGMYRVCRDLKIQGLWKKEKVNKWAKNIDMNNFKADNVVGTVTQKNTKKLGGFGSILKRSGGDSSE